MVLTGCKVETNIDIDVDKDGGGEVAVQVNLDEEATRAVPDLAQKMSVDDLRATGWTVDGPSVSEQMTTLSVSHSFDTPEQANALIDQLDSAGGPLRNFRVEQSRSFTKLDSHVSGTVDLSKGVASWGDPILQERAGTALGFDPKELQNSLGVNADEMFPVFLSVSLPGRSTTYMPTANNGKWTLAYGQVHELDARSKGLNVQPLTSFGIALFLLVAAVVIFLVWKPYVPMHRKPLLQ